MNYYEIVYIVHPALQAGHLDDIIAQVNKKIEQLNGKILYQDNWGKKKLSYLIQKQKYGTYILMQCVIDGVNINEISTDFELNTNILRHLVTKIFQDEVLEQKKSEENTTKNSKDENNKPASKLKESSTDTVKESDSEEPSDSEESSDSEEPSDSEESEVTNKEKINETGE